MIPVISMEGDSAQTDIRRGEGVAESIAKTMAELKKRNTFCRVGNGYFGKSLQCRNGNVSMN